MFCTVSGFVYFTKKDALDAVIEGVCIYHFNFT